MRVYAGKYKIMLAAEAQTSKRSHSAINQHSLIESSEAYRRWQAGAVRRQNIIDNRHHNRRERRQSLSAVVDQLVFSFGSSILILQRRPNEIHPAPVGDKARRAWATVGSAGWRDAGEAVPGDAVASVWRRSDKMVASAALRASLASVVTAARSVIPSNADPTTGLVRRGLIMAINAIFGICEPVETGARRRTAAVA